MIYKKCYLNSIFIYLKMQNIIFLKYLFKFIDLFEDFINLKAII